MNRIVRILGLGTLMLVLATSTISATGPYNPVADSYTNINNPTGVLDNFGLLVSYSTNPEGASQGTTFAFMRFDLSSIPQTINGATLSLYAQQVPTKLDSTMRVVLKGCSNDTWDEATLSHDNPGDAAMNCTIALGGEVAVPSNPGWLAFTSAQLATFLNAQRQVDGLATVKVEFSSCSLCNQTSDRARFEDRENSRGTTYLPQLDLTGPNSVGITALTGSASALPLAGGAAAAVAAAGALIWRRRSKAS
jgi:hypothetical protein